MHSAVSSLVLVVSLALCTGACAAPAADSETEDVGQDSADLSVGFPFRFSTLAVASAGERTDALASPAIGRLLRLNVSKGCSASFDLYDTQGRWLFPSRGPSLAGDFQTTAYFVLARGAAIAKVRSRITSRDGASCFASLSQSSDWDEEPTYEDCSRARDQIALSQGNRLTWAQTATTEWPGCGARAYFAKPNDKTSFDELYFKGVGRDYPFVAVARPDRTVVLVPVLTMANRCTSTAGC